MLNDGETSGASARSTWWNFYYICTACKRSCGKVMFLHLSVILFTGRGCIPACNGQGLYPQVDTPWAWMVPEYRSNSVYTSSYKRRRTVQYEARRQSVSQSSVVSSDAPRIAHRLVTTSCT